MRKEISGMLGAAKTNLQGVDGVEWIDVEAIAIAEVSSEDPAFPVENALLPASAGGWQATSPGAAHIRLRFVERQHERSQEWAVSAIFADGQHREIVRQGWNFSPGNQSPQSNEQSEIYSVALDQVTELLLWIDPDRGQDRYPATLQRWLLAR
jgi:hypothetical protein